MCSIFIMMDCIAKLTRLAWFWSCILPLFHWNFHADFDKNWFDTSKNTKYNKCLHRMNIPDKKLVQVCLKENCIALERLRVIAGDIWGRFLSLGYKIMVFVMSHYFSVKIMVFCVVWYYHIFVFPHTDLSCW